MERTFVAQLTQFQLPKGQKKVIRIVLPGKLEEKYNALTRRGCRLTSEELRTSQLSVAVEEPQLGDFICKVLPQGTRIEDALTHAISSFDEETFEEWKALKEG